MPLAGSESPDIPRSDKLVKSRVFPNTSALPQTLRLIHLDHFLFLCLPHI